MDVKTLIEKLSQCDETKSVILIHNGDTLNIDDVYVWDEASDIAADSPVELISNP